ncbi:MAG: AAA family ATPase [Thermomicrobiales bacterium]
MFDVCPHCGLWSVERAVEDAENDWGIATCPHCGDRLRFRRLPLFLVVGASGTGKTTLGFNLVHQLPDHVVMESDILWGTVDADADGSWSTYHNHWLRLVKNIHQAGRSVVLCGIADPETMEALPERRYLGTLHWLVLVADDEVLADRLRARPDWRESSGEEFVTSAVNHNRWYRGLAASDPSIPMLDTSRLDREAIAFAATAWVRSR